MNSRPVRYAVKARIELTDRSTLRVMMTTAWPTASSTRIDGSSRKLRQPSALNRKPVLLVVAATTTATSTSKIEISRDRTTVLKMRRRRDRALGSTSKASLVVTSARCRA